MTAATQSIPPEFSPDVTVRSTPETVVWGYIAADLPPVLRIKSGQTVGIDTVTHQGINTRQDPVTYFGAAGIPPEQVLPDAVDVYRKVTRAEGAGPHLLTGPVYVEGAQPGDKRSEPIVTIDRFVPSPLDRTRQSWPDGGAVSARESTGVSTASSDGQTACRPVH